jgi:hypothetical protein
MGNENGGDGRHFEQYFSSIHVITFPLYIKIIK